MVQFNKGSNNSLCLRDWTHLGIFGSAGTGKTYFACKYAKVCCPRFIFVNPLLKSKIRRVCNSHVSDVGGMAEALYRGKNRIDFLCAEHPETAQAQVKEIKQFLFDIGNKMNAEDKWWITLLVDEADIIFPKFGKSDSGLLRRGRHYGVHVVLISQRPQFIDPSAVNQLSHQIFFRLSAYSQPYYTEYSIPIEEHLTHLKKPYHYVLWDSFDMKEFSPVK
jgi:hypothetical protein